MAGCFIRDPARAGEVLCPLPAENAVILTDSFDLRAVFLLLFDYAILVSQSAPNPEFECYISWQNLF
jgi:hypothetical protein